MIGKERERERDTPCVFVSFFFILVSVEYYDSRKAKKREDMFLDFLYERSRGRYVYVFAHANAREVLFLSKLLCV